MSRFRPPRRRADDEPVIPMTDAAVEKLRGARRRKAPPGKGLTDIEVERLRAVLSADPRTAPVSSDLDEAS